jgi:hypothetical protein
MRIKTGPASKAAEVEAVAASGVENDVARARTDHLRDSVQKGRGHTAVVQSPPRGDGLHRISRMLRSPLLGLEQIDVPAARYVERMTARTTQPLLAAFERQMAVAHRAQEHDRL